MRKYNINQTQANLSEESQHEDTDPEDILQKVDLSGIAEWDPKM